MRTTIVMVAIVLVWAVSSVAEEMGGTGVWIVDRNKPDEPLRTGQVWPKSPADKAGIKEDWFIISIDGTNVVHMPIVKAVNMVRGPVGKVVTLEIANPTRSKTNKFLVKRGRIVIAGNQVVKITDE